MQTPDNALNANAAHAAALALRLEAINKTVKTSAASQMLIDATMKINLTYAIFLTELEDGISPLSEQQIQDMLENTENHCAIYEAEFSKVVKGSSEQ